MLPAPANQERRALLPLRPSGKQIPVLAVLQRGRAVCHPLESLKVLCNFLYLQPQPVPVSSPVTSPESSQRAPKLLLRLALRVMLVDQWLAMKLK